MFYLIILLLVITVYNVFQWCVTENTHKYLRVYFVKHSLYY